MILMLRDHLARLATPSQHRQHNSAGSPCPKKRRKEAAKSGPTSWSWAHSSCGVGDAVRTDAISRQVVPEVMLLLEVLGSGSRYQFGVKWYCSEAVCTDPWARLGKRRSSGWWIPGGRHCFGAGWGLPAGMGNRPGLWGRGEGQTQTRHASGREAWAGQRQQGPGGEGRRLVTSRTRGAVPP